jgi:hypothetical protein
MSHKQKLKELLEKLKVHAENKNDDELKAIVASFEAAADDGDGEGGNSPDTPPDLP